jgi:hypothetical protein
MCLCVLAGEFVCDYPVMRDYALGTRCRLHVSPPIAAVCVGQTRARDGDPRVWGVHLHPLPTPTRATSQFADCSGPTPSPRRAGVSRLLQLRGQGLRGEVSDVSLRYHPFSGWGLYSMYAASREWCSVVFSRSVFMAVGREWFVASAHILLLRAAGKAAPRRPVPGSHRAFKPKPRPVPRTRVTGRSRTSMRLALSRRLFTKGTLVGGPDDASEAAVSVSGSMTVTAIRASNLRNREVFGKQVRTGCLFLDADVQHCVATLFGLAKLPLPPVPVSDWRATAV